jgi:uncharacterized protein (DUF2235 family)
MPKRIVVCSDGTGNTATKGRGTNVFKLFEAVDLDSHRFDANVTPQIAIYDDGVGTENFKPLKMFGGATGWGLSRNVRHLYKELARVYDPGDEIYMFGFSRGAFTVRTLVGLIGTCGLIDPERLPSPTFGGLNSAVKMAYRAYRACYRPWLWRQFAKPSKDAAAKFKEAHSFQTDVMIRFVGVWDTVDAVGLPFHLSDVLNATVYQFKFPDHHLSPLVQRACHALAIDDQRQSFHPLLWTERDEDRARISQVWFAGAHANVGGGYPKQGMSLVALDWLLTEAEQAGVMFNQHGLRLNASERQSFREHASVDDKLYDPRAGLGFFYRWKIRDIDAMCKAHNIFPKVHVSVLERVAHGTDDYSPGNLPAHAQVVFTEPVKAEHMALAEHRAACVQKVLATIPEKTLLNDVRPWIRVGQASYYVYILSAAAVLIAEFGPAPDTVLRQLGVAVTPLAIGLAVSFLMVLFVDHQLEEAFSRFWYPKQKELRDNLKQAREDVRTLQANLTVPADKEYHASV